MYNIYTTTGLWMMALVQASAVNNSSTDIPRDVRDILSEKYFTWALPMTVFQILMSVLGIFCNSVLLIICCRKKLKNSAMFYIGSVAVVDLFACVVVIPLQIVHSSRYYTYDNEIACKLFLWFKMSTLASSCLLFMAIAVDRYKAICKPFMWRSAGRKGAVVIATTCILTGVICMTPELILVGVQQYSLNQTIRRFNFSPDDISVIDLNQSCHICEHLNSFSLTWELKTFFAAALAIFTILVAVAILCYSRIAIVMSRSRRNLSVAYVGKENRNQAIPLREMNRHSAVCDYRDTNESAHSDKDSLSYSGISLHNNTDSASKNQLFCEQNETITARVNAPNGANHVHSKSQTRPINSSLGKYYNGARKGSLDSRKQFDVSKALMIVTIVFLVTWLPYWVIGIYGLIFPFYHITSSSEIVIILEFLQQLFFLNNAVNPIVYLIYSAEFRHHCKLILNRRSLKLVK